MIPVQDDTFSDLEVVHNELLEDPSVHLFHRLALLVYKTVLMLSTHRNYENHFVTKKRLFENVKKKGHHGR